MKPSNKLEKYLIFYSEEESREDHFIGDCRDFVLVIPSYNEGEDFFFNIEKILKESKKIILIIIFNCPEGISDEQKQKQKEAIKKFKNQFAVVEASKNYFYGKFGDSIVIFSDLILIKKKDGVGRARKIGADLALKLINEGKVKNKIIFSTDADSKLPLNYFNKCCDLFKQNPKASAISYPFWHENSGHEEQDQAIRLYEKKMSYYVDGLKRAGSPYAYHSLGSTISMRAESYLNVRGFPKRPAGEDFYILNKLRKVGDIISPKADPVLLSSRVSLRVPFGTGPSLNRILQEGQMYKQKIFYNPKAFEYLSEIHKAKLFLFDQGVQSFLMSLSDIGKKAFLSLRGSVDFLARIDALKNKKQKEKAFDDWFDAFLTLKYIHLIKDNFYENISCEELTHHFS